MEPGGCFKYLDAHLSDKSILEAFITDPFYTIAPPAFKQQLKYNFAMTLDKGYDIQVP
jgi:hypothetical protein